MHMTIVFPAYARPQRQTPDKTGGVVAHGRGGDAEGSYTRRRHEQISPHGVGCHARRPWRGGMFDHIRRLWKRLTGQEDPTPAPQQPFWAIGPNGPEGHSHDISIDAALNERDEQRRQGL
jgi:hypothetical protein